MFRTALFLVRHRLWQGGSMILRHDIAGNAQALALRALEPFPAIILLRLSVNLRAATCGCPLESVSLLKIILKRPQDAESSPFCLKFYRQKPCATKKSRPSSSSRVFLLRHMISEMPFWFRFLKIRNRPPACQLMSLPPPRRLLSCGRFPRDAEGVHKSNILLRVQTLY